MADLLSRLSATLEQHPGVLAMWITGSVARGVSDHHSDLDVEVVVPDGGAPAFLEAVPGLLAAAADPVLVRSFGSLVTFVTREWERADLLVRERGEVERRGVPTPVDVLFDRDELVTVTPHRAAETSDARLRDVIDEFLRCLGLLPTVAARQEWASALVGTGAMIGLALELMQIQNGTRRVGGALRLNERLTVEQRSVVAALPALRAEASSVVSVQHALAADFLPRARQVAAQLSVAFPTDAETAVWEHLQRHGLGID